MHHHETRTCSELYTNMMETFILLLTVKCCFVVKEKGIKYDIDKQYDRTTELLIAQKHNIKQLDYLLCHSFCHMKLPPLPVCNNTCFRT